MKNYLAVDIGGSKTRIVVFNREGTVAESETKGVGLAFESTSDLPEYREALLSVKEKYKISTVAVNLGGRNSIQVKTVTESVFDGVPCRVVRESEGDAALAFAKRIGANVVLLAGTGTILIATSGNQKGIFGGWGMNIGDGGSGYDIGLSAIRKTLLALDGTAPLTPLEQEISGLSAPISPVADAATICEMRDAVRARLQHTDRRAVASLVRRVAEHASNGEMDALALFSDAGEKMGALVVCGARKLRLESALTVAATGGLLNVLPYWQSKFENTIITELGASRFVYEKDGLIRGVMALAKELEHEN